MDGFENVAAQLAERFGLDVALLLDAGAFRAAFVAAVRHMSADAFVAGIVESGPLTAARNPTAVVIGRARRLVAGVELRARIEGELADARRQEREKAAARYRQLLASLIQAGEITVDEAREELARRGLTPAPDREQEAAW
ncbi:MAG: hypothetical protein M0Z69_00435 [Actinomycetota bacterium]|nr:hypothetical protein [Actinomycetota bacterium]